MKMRMKVLGLILLVIASAGVASAHYGQIEDGKKTEISGMVQEIYHMGFLLDNGKFVMAPWWFISESGIDRGDEVKVTGIVEDNTIFPYTIEVNGRIFGNPTSEYPPWMGADYGGYWHCPMM